MIQCSPQEKQRLIPLIQQYFEEELDQEIGHLAAEFLVDFFLKEIGPFIYNRALQDVQAMLTQQLAEMDDRLYEMTQPLPR